MLLPENQNFPGRRDHHKAAVDKNKVAWNTASEWNKVDTKNNCRVQNVFEWVDILRDEWNG